MRSREAVTGTRPSAWKSEPSTASLNFNTKIPRAPRHDPRFRSRNGSQSAVFGIDREVGAFIQSVKVYSPPNSSVSLCATLDCLCALCDELRFLGWYKRHRGYALRPYHLGGPALKSQVEPQSVIGQSDAIRERGLGFGVIRKVSQMGQIGRARIDLTRHFHRFIDRHVRRMGHGT